MITVIPTAKGVATFLAPAVWVVIMLVGQRPHIRLVFGSVEKVGKKPFASFCEQKAIPNTGVFHGPIDDLLRASVFAVQLVEDEVAVEALKIVHEEDQFGFPFRFGVVQTDHPFRECLDSDDLEATIVLIGFHAN